MNIARGAAKDKDKARVGLHQLKARIQLKGLNSIDRRMGAARSLLQWRAAVVADMGGEENLTAAKRAVIEEATRTKAYLDHVDAFLLSLESVIDRKSRKLRPIVDARMRIGEHLMKQLDRLGLERVPKPVPTLAEVNFVFDRPVPGRDRDKLIDVGTSPGEDNR
jgi:hypothetical protein